MATFSKFLNNSKLSRSQIILLLTSSISLSFWIYSVIKDGQLNRSSKTVKKNEYILLDKKKDNLKDFTLISFLNKLRIILNLTLAPKEYGYAFGVGVILILKTINDIWLINNGVEIEAAIINSNLSKLKQNLGNFFLSMPTLVVTNNLLKYFLNQLKLNLRFNLSKYLYSKYMKSSTLYSLNVLDLNCQNIDQLLTSDVEKFCKTVVDVYSNISKPILDIITLVYRLSVNYTGFKTPGSMIGYLILVASILVQARKPLTCLTVKEAQLEGQLRYIHSQLIINCEEITFYQGNEREMISLMNVLKRLTSHLHTISVFKFNLDFLESLTTRYFATVVGYLSLALPFLNGKIDNKSDRLKIYYKSGKMMVKLAESIGRLASAGLDFSRLAGYTQRVWILMKSIEENQNLSHKNFLPYKQISGTVKLCDIAEPKIVLTNVTLCTPSGDVLVDSLSFSVLQGQNVLVTGPNGCGKSSLFRIIGELWPVYQGQLIKPPNNKIFYIPQKPYLTFGSLRDQIIYPDTYQDMIQKGISDDDIRKILAKVELVYLLEREYSFDSVLYWQEILSGGEKQRIAIARLIYNKPLFAILDECTSAVSLDVEQSIYSYLINNIGCTLLSVTHRIKQLQHFHQLALKFDGYGNYSFEEIEDDSILI